MIEWRSQAFSAAQRPGGRRSMVPPLLLLLVLAGCGGNAADPTAYAPAKITHSEPESLGRSAEGPATAAPAPTPIGPIQVFFSEVWSSPEQNKANPNSIALHCARFIDRARSTLDVCGFEINNEVIIDFIVRAHRRGVRVRVATETDYLNELGPRTFRAEGIPVISDNREPLMHNKFIIVDNHEVWTGSFNFTENCAYKNNNNGVQIVHPKLAANYTEKFRWFWEYHKFGGKPYPSARIPYPVFRTEDGIVIENYFSTHDHVDQKVIARISAARQSLKFMAFSFTHDGIARAVTERADAGVKVAGVVETRQVSKSSEFDRLSHHRNVDVLLDGNKYQMHHKVFIIDDEVVVAGSYNFSSSATHDNDENCVILHDPRVARRFNEEFARVYRAAASAVTSQAGGTLRR